jgi:hypothetical protein
MFSLKEDWRTMPLKYLKKGKEQGNLLFFWVIESVTGTWQKKKAARDKLENLVSNSFV